MPDPEVASESKFSTACNGSDFAGTSAFRALRPPSRPCRSRWATQTLSSRKFYQCAQASKMARQRPPRSGFGKQLRNSAASVRARTADSWRRKRAAHASRTAAADAALWAGVARLRRPLLLREVVLEAQQVVGEEHLDGDEHTTEMGPRVAVERTAWGTGVGLAIPHSSPVPARPCAPQYWSAPPRLTKAPAHSEVIDGRSRRARARLLRVRA